MELDLARPTALSREVAKKPSPVWPGGALEIWISVVVIFFSLGNDTELKQGGGVSVDAMPCLIPCKSTFFNDVKKAEQEGANEKHHFHETYFPEGFEIGGPGVHKDHLDIKHDKEDGGEEVFDGKRDPGVADAFDTAFKGFQFVTGLPRRSCKPDDDDGGGDKTDCHQELDEYPYVIR